MPRTYRFDHFTVAKSTPSRGLRRRDKQHLSEKRVSERRFDKYDTQPHYGKNHAETEELLQVRAMNAQLEALAGLSANAPLKPTATNRGQPIGAVPLSAVPALERGSEPRDVLDEALRQLHAVREGLHDATQAASRLLSLPVDAARLIASRLRPVLG